MNEIPTVVSPDTDRGAVGERESRAGHGRTRSPGSKTSREADLAHGGARFAQWLSAEALVDEYRLRVHPVALCDGLPLFRRLPSPKRLRRVVARPFSAGVVLARASSS